MIARDLKYLPILVIIIVLLFLTNTSAGKFPDSVKRLSCDGITMWELGEGCNDAYIVIDCQECIWEVITYDKSKNAAIIKEYLLYDVTELVEELDLLDKPTEDKQVDKAWWERWT